MSHTGTSFPGDIMGIFKGFLGIGTLALSISLGGGLAALAPSSFAAARELTPAEHKEVYLAIKQVEQVWPNSQAARALRARLIEGTLLVDDRMPSKTLATTNYPLVGKQVITLTPTLVPDSTRPVYRQDTRFGQAALFDDRTKLASVLVHEWLHTTQSFLDSRINRFNTGRMEIPAYELQISYLRALLVLVKDNPTFAARVDSLIEYFGFELEEYKR